MCKQRIHVEAYNQYNEITDICLPNLKKPSTQNDLDLSIVKYIIRGMRPLSTVTNKQFDDIINGKSYKYLFLFCLNSKLL